MAVGNSQADRHRRAVGAARRPGRAATHGSGGGHASAPPPAPGIGSTAGGHIAAAASVVPGVAAWGAQAPKGYTGPGAGLFDGMEPWHAVALVLGGVLIGSIVLPRR